ncbi:hypothetical protein KC340_g3891 [Hortaea werneckii]|nr:hypothetical protein KC342_g3918 [Hortaea werneckii]KAI7102575.1 hypothetical protein KC339_g5902 [Hortaea werneckii]KAI7237651.1 hypothetical protein KC365_g4699 [Hortaea werneckii]KAI7331293.1 hypothetical protein KC340_g3891 [Hortaea werneckii]KAI7385446.1 hypothetical protein KC328_g10335 [Hortaea werneckii]
MADASNIRLSLGEWPQYYREGILQESANTASDLLQKNHQEHHIFFNQSGFHNHIAHHLLTIYALSAGPGEIQKAYNVNVGYQRPPQPLDDNLLAQLHDPEKFSSCLGKERYYHDFLVFFQKEMSDLGWQNVVNKYLLAGDERADDLLARLFGGFLHPIIHLGFGVEFSQPAIVAEALAQGAVHDNYMGKFFSAAERAAELRRGEPSETMVKLLDAIHDDKQLRDAPKWSDGNKLRDGIMNRAGDAMVQHTSQYHVRPDELELKTAEMINANAYYTAGAQREGKAIKWDFYYMHCVNCSIFYSAFLKADWISEANKCRLLEWKVWNDLAMYASRKCPDIRLDLVRNHQPTQPSAWDSIEDRACALEDDGHTSKLIRALAHGQNVCRKYEAREEFRVKHDDWLQMAHSVIDSVDVGDSRWVRSAGFDEAWENVPARAQL